MTITPCSRSAGASVRALTPSFSSYRAQAHITSRPGRCRMSSAEHVLAVPFRISQAHGGWFWVRPLGALRNPPFGPILNCNWPSTCEHGAAGNRPGAAIDSCLAQRRLISTLGSWPVQSVAIDSACPARALSNRPYTRAPTAQAHICLASESMETKINRMRKWNRSANVGKSLRIQPRQGNHALQPDRQRKVSRLPQHPAEATSGTYIDGDVLCQMDSERLSQR